MNDVQQAAQSQVREIADRIRGQVSTAAWETVMNNLPSWGYLVRQNRIVVTVHSGIRAAIRVIGEADEAAS